MNAVVPEGLSMLGVLWMLYDILNAFLCWFCTERVQSLVLFRHRQVRKAVLAIAAPIIPCIVIMKDVPIVATRHERAVGIQGLPVGGKVAAAEVPQPRRQDHATTLGEQLWVGCFFCCQSCSILTCLTTYAERAQGEGHAVRFSCFAMIRNDHRPWLPFL